MKEAAVAMTFLLVGLTVLLFHVLAEIATLNRAIKNSGYKTERTYDPKTGYPIDRLVKTEEAEKFGGGE